MLCRVCRKDLPKDFYALDEYQRAMGKGICTVCFTCSKLSKKDKRKRTIAAIQEFRGTTRTEEQKEWDTLSEEEKRESLIAKRTTHEKLLAEALTERRIEFDVQVPVGPYFVDFQIKPGKLAVEVDGEYHNHGDQVRKDKMRTGFLRSQGWRVIRFSNDRVKRDIGRVIGEIRAEQRRKVKTLGTGGHPTGEWVVSPPKKSSLDRQWIAAIQNDDKRENFGNNPT